jgi:Fe-S oxidoreductase
MGMRSFFDTLQQGILTIDEDTLAYHIDPLPDDLTSSSTAGAALPCERLFIPGCSFLNYSLQLVQHVYDMLHSEGLMDGISLQCCGKILDYEGSGGRTMKPAYRELLARSLIAAGVRQILVACPNCHAEFLKFIADDERLSDIQVAVLPEELAKRGYRINEKTVRYIGPVSVQDPCPDRARQVFDDSVRAIIGEEHIAEMKNNRRRSICCGARVRAVGCEDAALRMARGRVDEARDAGGEMIVTACMSCSYVLTAAQRDLAEVTPLPVRHYLELLFDEQIEWAEKPEHLSVRFLLGM